MLSGKHEQALELLGDLLDVVRNPDTLKTMLEEMKAATEEYRKYKEDNRKIGDVDTWYVEKCGVLDSREKKLDTLKKSLEQWQGEMKAKLADKESAVNKKLDDAAAKEKEWQTKLSALADVDAAQKALEQDRASLSAQKSELKKKEDELNKKLHGVEALLKEGK